MRVLQLLPMKICCKQRRALVRRSCKERLSTRAGVFEADPRGPPLLRVQLVDPCDRGYTTLTIVTTGNRRIRRRTQNARLLKRSDVAQLGTRVRRGARQRRVAGTVCCAGCAKPACGDLAKVFGMRVIGAVLCTLVCCAWLRVGACAAATDASSLPAQRVEAAPSSSMDASARPRINLLVATDTHSSSGAAFEVVFRGGATLPWLRSSPRGAVRVHVDGQWFVSGDAVDVPPGASLLVRGDVTNTSGRDRVLGQWTGVRVAWAAASTPVVTETRNYGGGWVTFDLSFPAGAQNVTLPGAATLRTRGVVQPYPKGLDAVSASFPTVDISCGADVGRLTCQLPRLSYATWWQDQQPNTQQLAAQQGVGLHSYFGGLVGGSPLVLFDESDGAYGGGMPTLVVSQAVHYRDTVLSAAASLELDSSPDGATSTDLQSGPHGYLTSVPAGTTFRTIMVAGSNGISRTLNDWGRKLLRMANKTVDHSTSLAANKIGYFTDNGAYCENSPSPRLRPQLGEQHDSHSACLLRLG